MKPENKREHEEQSIQDELGECDLCGKSAILKPMVYNNDEDKMLCSSCWSDEECRGDMEYERWKDEQSELGEGRKVYDPDDPDHERDIPEERS
jgi:hypothetical protein